MKQPSKFTPVIISSVFMVVISLFPFLNFINLLCCAGIVIGGAAGTFFYANALRAAGQLIQFKDGAMIGLLSGFISAVIVVFLSTIMAMLVNQNPVPELYRMLDSGGFQIPEQMEKILQSVSDEYAKNGYSLTLTLVSLAMYGLTYPLFGAIGGLLTVSFYNKRKPDTEAPPSPPDIPANV